MNDKLYIAHPNLTGGPHQSVKQHLEAVAKLAAHLATKLGFARLGLSVSDNLYNQKGIDHE